MGLFYDKFKRYWVNSDYFTGLGPVFIKIGEEAEASPWYMTNDQWINNANKFNALCVML